VLYHIGVMQLIIRAAAWLMTRVMGASGAESLNVAASIFMGQEPKLRSPSAVSSQLTKSELMCVMTSGMAHISGGMMAGYIQVGGADPKNLLTAHHDGPGTLLMAKMLVPETEHLSPPAASKCLRWKRSPISSAPSPAAPATASASP